MPNLEPWVNQNNYDYEGMTTKTITNKFENHLLSIKTERQKMIHPNSHPTYNERHQKIIEMIEYVEWEDRTDPNTFNIEIIFSKSNDNGETFSMPDNISNNAGTSINADISSEGANVYVV